MNDTDYKVFYEKTRDENRRLIKENSDLYQECESHKARADAMWIQLTEIIRIALGRSPTDETIYTGGEH